MNELELMLESLPLHPFLLIVSKLLSRAGFGDVEVMDRRTERQKSRYGGAELRCSLNLGALPVKISVKVIPDSLRVRMLDELIGMTRRTASTIGLIVSSKEASSAVKSLAENLEPNAFVFDVHDISRLMRRYGLGVRKSGEVDYAFFGTLEEVSSRVEAFMKELP